jgi:hypothetical protein
VSDLTDIKPVEAISKEISRRNFIKGVIASGAAVSSANYLFRAARRPARAPPSASSPSM